MPLGLVFFVVVIDQLVKHLIVTSMRVGQTIPVIKDVFHITYVLNPGAAFGMLENQRWVFILAALLVVGVATVFYKRIQRETIYIRCGAWLMMGGAIGNLIDRIQSGLVVDFLDFRAWPVFNIADIAICVGAGLLIYDIWQRRNEDDFFS